MSEADTSDNKIHEAAEEICLNVEHITEQVESVLGEELYWFPVRHHSPTAARHVETAILERKPKVVFIEAPADAGEMIPHIIHKDTRPPVAIYSSYRDDDNVLGLAGIASPSEDIPARFASWYPLMTYSPEYVAMKAAAKVKADTVFMDLPHYATLKPHDENGDDESADGPEVFNTEELMVQSGFYQTLARVAGYRTWEEAWDSLFEFGAYARDRETFRRELATFCAAARATSSQERIRTDGTLEREAKMLQTIRTTLAEKEIKPSDAMVVCGGFHLFLDRDSDLEPPASPDGSVYSSLIPYSFFQVSELSGYGAGNRAPQFYQAYWEHAKRDKLEELLPSHVVNILKQARRLGESLSPADAIAVNQHAHLLAKLRRRDMPVLDDVHDALMTCCCKGDPEFEGLHLRKAIDHVDIGRAIGRVTKNVGRLPVVCDFFSCLGELDLEELVAEEKVMSLKLDKRNELDHKRSAFLHRLLYLEIPVGTLRDSGTPDITQATIFQERWSLKWTPQIEPKLVEKNLYGDTVETAAFARLREELAEDSQHAGNCCERMRRAMDMDLPDLVQQIQDQCSDTIAADTRLVSLAKALHNLLLIQKHATFRNLRQDIIQELVRQCYDRACFAVPSSASVPDDQQDAVIDALRTMAEAVFQDKSDELDPALFGVNVRNAAEQSTVPYLQGAFYGMLAELKEIPASDVTDILGAYAKATPDVMVNAGDFLDGMLAVSRTSIILGADSLVASIEDLLIAAEQEAFLTMLPRIRAAFERLHERHRHSLARRVAERHGLAEVEQVSELSTSFGAALLIARIDQQVDEIMKNWEF